MVVVSTVKPYVLEFFKKIVVRGAQNANQFIYLKIIKNVNNNKSEWIYTALPGNLVFSQFIQNSYGS